MHQIPAEDLGEVRDGVDVGGQEHARLGLADRQDPFGAQFAEQIRAPAPQRPDLSGCGVRLFQDRRCDSLADLNGFPPSSGARNIEHPILFHFQVEAFVQRRACSFGQNHTDPIPFLVSRSWFDPVH